MLKKWLSYRDRDAILSTARSRVRAREIADGIRTPPARPRRDLLLGPDLDAFHRACAAARDLSACCRRRQ